MVRKLIAASYVVLWLFLFGVEFTEDLGFIRYNDPSMDSSIDAALADLGEALKISDNASQSSALVKVSLPPAVLNPSATRSALFEEPQRLTGFLKVDRPIYKLHSVFLI